MVNVKVAVVAGTEAVGRNHDGAGAVVRHIEIHFARGIDGESGIRSSSDERVKERVGAGRIQPVEKHTTRPTAGGLDKRYLAHRSLHLYAIGCKHDAGA
jgi:hypothetical protein